MDELVGQLIWAFIGDPDDLKTVEKAISRGRVGGVWLLPTEMTGPRETAEVISRLQDAAPQPLLVGVDAEAGLGLVMRGATLLPTAMAMGVTGDPDLARAAGAVTAAEAAACGINAVAAPVLDVNNNPANPIINTRAFGEDPDLVGRMAVAFMEGLEASSSAPNPVLPIGKHFPGHGDTVEDSHLRLSSVDQSRSRLQTVELKPFRAAIAAGIPMLMTAHVAYPALDESGAPATLSRPILTDLLRHRMGFEGAIVTDCMNMHAIAHNFDPGEAAVQAVRAGCDLILTEQWDLVYEALLHAILEDELRGSHIRAAAQRVRNVKSRIFGPQLSKPAPVEPSQAQSEVGTDQHRAVAGRIASASVRVLGGRLVPPAARPLIMATRMARRYGPTVETQVRSALAENGWEDVDLMPVNPVPEEAEIGEAVRRAQAAGWAALLHFNRVESFDPEAVQAKGELASLANAIADAGVPLTVVSMGSPYILPAFPRACAQVCAYNTSNPSLHATLKLVLGSALLGGEGGVSAAAGAG